MGEMTNSVLKSRGFRASIFVFCLALVFYVGARYLEGTDVALQNAKPKWVLVALAIQILAMATAALTWKTAVKKAAQHSLPWNEAFLHISLNLIAKYVPGKIWGLAARHSMLVGQKISHTKAAQALVYEQFSYFFTGTLIATPAFYLTGKSLFPWLSHDTIILFGALVASGLLALFVGKRLSISLWMAVEKYRLLFLTASLQWAADILTLVLITYALSIPLSGWEYLTLSSALPAAVIAGMLAIFVPSGIGVREGALVLLCSPILEPEPALACAVILRALTTVRDMIAGIGAAGLIRVARQ